MFSPGEFYFTEEHGTKKEVKHYFKSSTSFMTCSTQTKNKPENDFYIEQTENY